MHTIISQDVQAQDYYLDNHGDTVVATLIELKLGRLYFYGLEGNPKYINLANIEGFKMGEEPYYQMSSESLKQIRRDSWLINYKPDSVYDEQLGFEGGVRMSFGRRDSDIGYFQKHSGYPFVYKKSKKYKNAQGGLRVLMPYVAIMYKTDNMKIYSVGIGYTQSNVYQYEHWSSANVRLKDRYFYWQYESPLRSKWIKTKKSAKEIRYPLYGLGISLNSKNLIYEKIESNESTLGGSIFDKYYSELSYRDYSMLISFQTKLGGYWQIVNYYFKWGVNINLMSYAHGRYYRREYYHSFVPDYETNDVEEGTYSTIVPFTLKNSGLFLSVGVYLD